MVAGQIVRGEIAPGEMLPREVDLAEEYRVSRGVARECIRGLEERGLIAVTHGRGARVTPASDWNGLDPIVLAALGASGADAHMLSEVHECFELLEIEAAGLAAERASADEVAAIGAALTQLELAAERARVDPAARDLSHEADLAFTRAVLAAAGNATLVRIGRSLGCALTAQRPAARSHHRYGRGLSDHGRVLTAIADGDPGQARAATRDRLAASAGRAAGTPRDADLVATP